MTGQGSIAIIGLPASGKSTYLAALWHVVSSREIPTALKFGSLRGLDATHLNVLAKRWRNAEVQVRTEASARTLVSMSLLWPDNRPVGVSFPDLSGESYEHMWQDRACAPEIAELLSNASHVLVFVHADRIRNVRSLLEVRKLSEELGLPLGKGKSVSWHPKLAPTQVQVVDILQLLRLPPLDAGDRRISVMLSAWDRVAPEGRTPMQFLAERLPLLDQYLRYSRERWQWRVYGISAQGGDLTKPEDAARLRAIDLPSKRIRLIHESGESHDPTEPLAWLIS